MVHPAEATDLTESANRNLVLEEGSVGGRQMAHRPVTSVDHRVVAAVERIVPRPVPPAGAVAVLDITVDLAVVVVAPTRTTWVRVAAVAGRRTHPALEFQEPTTQPTVQVPQRLVPQFHI